MKDMIMPCEVYSRVVGYYRPVHNWNRGKQQEFKERKEFCEKTSLTNPKAIGPSEPVISESEDAVKSAAVETTENMSAAIDSYKIFTFPNCSKCEEVKSFLKEKPFSGAIIDLKTPEGNKEFRSYYSDRSIKENIKTEDDGTLKLPVVFYMSKGKLVSTAQGLEAMSILA